MKVSEVITGIVIFIVAVIIIGAVFGAIATVVIIPVELRLTEAIKALK